MRLLMTLLVSLLSLPVFADEPPALQSKKQQIKDTLNLVYQRKDTQETEAYLRRELLINDAELATLGIRGRVVSALVGIYKRQERWKDAEMLLETYGSSTITQPHRDEVVAEVLIKQEKYAEAMLILGKFVPNLKPPGPGTFCGNPYLHYQKLKGMYEFTSKKARGKRQDKPRDERVAEYWKELQKEVSQLQAD